MAIPSEAVATDAYNSETKLPELIKDCNNIWKQHTMMTKKQPLGHHSVQVKEKRRKFIIKVRCHLEVISSERNLREKEYPTSEEHHIWKTSHQASFTSSPLCKTTAIRIEAFIRTCNSQILPLGKGLFSSPEVSATNRKRAYTFPGGRSYLFWHFCYRWSPW